jgi:hypothetical protein
VSTSNYRVSTQANGEYFANFLYRAFGPYDGSWTGPRPFDISPTNRTQVDGFDFDIEAKFGLYQVRMNALTMFSDDMQTMRHILPWPTSSVAWRRP